MTLSEYIKSSGLSDLAFSKLSGVSHSQINRLKRGMSRPSLDSIDAIFKASGGKVTHADWFDKEIRGQ
jgi:transcriptional regulator with XRE-family HTH domain